MPEKDIFKLSAAVPAFSALAGLLVAEYPCRRLGLLPVVVRAHVQREPDDGEDRHGDQHADDTPDLSEEDDGEEDDDTMRLPHLLVVGGEGAGQRLAPAHEEGAEQVAHHEFDEKHADDGGEDPMEPEAHIPDTINVEASPELRAVMHGVLRVAVDRGGEEDEWYGQHGRTNCANLWDEAQEEACHRDDHRQVDVEVLQENEDRGCERDIEHDRDQKVAPDNAVDVILQLVQLDVARGAPLERRACGSIGDMEGAEARRTPASDAVGEASKLLWPSGWALRLGVDFARLALLQQRLDATVRGAPHAAPPARQAADEVAARPHEPPVGELCLGVSECDGVVSSFAPSKLMCKGSKSIKALYSRKKAKSMSRALEVATMLFNAHKAIPCNFAGSSSTALSKSSSMLCTKAAVWFWNCLGTLCSNSGTHRWTAFAKLVTWCLYKSNLSMTVETSSSTKVFAHNAAKPTLTSVRTTASKRNM
eukprot:CAMPEP_0176223482 /NCGR_PEP_ID=MMETSP0121_2-20121125/20765_1 /TAXON_ID=160619 /ORGANISM="Kryptoperidinium foliaceum, Strain CCMP 1326" /LENGTH=477 /DNA_ID=CAMNT_0017562713 /DNA_START=53 /DNA_END=1487 /DNA_ORIENTATION=-